VCCEKSSWIPPYLCCPGRPMVPRHSTARMTHHAVLRAIIHYSTQRPAIGKTFAGAPGSDRSLSSVIRPMPARSDFPTDIGVDDGPSTWEAQKSKHPSPQLKGRCQMRGQAVSESSSVGRDSDRVMPRTRSAMRTNTGRRSIREMRRANGNGRQRDRTE